MSLLRAYIVFASVLLIGEAAAQLISQDQTASQSTNQATSVAQRLMTMISQRSQNSIQVSPEARRILEETIADAESLIKDYETNGVSEITSLPDVPGISLVRTLPKRLMDAEVAMIRDNINMAKKMSDSPLSATMSLSNDVSGMFSRMTEALNG